MGKLLLSVVLAVALGASSVAMAAAPKVAPTTSTITGKVLSVNAKLCTVTLSNKGTYVFAKSCALSKVTVGEKVVITWWMSGNQRDASKIAAA